jgi:hypothetical protein
MNWIPMLEYSLRHKVSLSTLRRRIKASLVEFKMESGRYLIKDTEVLNYTKGSTPSPDTPQMFIQELKKAYGTILSEKEEMIVQLKNEIEDLRKINLLLEKEIERNDLTRARTEGLLDL